MFTAEEELFAFERTISRLTEMQTRQYWESAYVKEAHWIPVCAYNRVILYIADYLSYFN